MKLRSIVTALLVVLPMSTFMAACGDEPDADEQIALDQDLDLALEPDTTVEPELGDVPLDEPPAESPAQPEPAPAPAPQPAQPQPQPEPAPSEPEGPRTVTRTIPAATTMAVLMNQQLSTESVSVGDAFTASLAEPVVGTDGVTLIPAGATVRGRVTGAQASGQTGETAVLKLAFESVSFDGESYPMSATIVDVPVERVTRDSRTEQAAKIGGGAAIGAVLGQIIGKDTESTVAGAAIGAAAGTAVAMGTADVDAVIPEGARVVIELDSPIEVEQTVS